MRWTDLEALAATDWAKAALAGAAGGIVRWLRLGLGWREGSASVVVGSICAIYLGPMAEPAVKPIVGTFAPGGDSVGFSGFVLGLGGLSLAGFIIETIGAFGKKSKAEEGTNGEA